MGPRRRGAGLPAPPRALRGARQLEELQWAHFKLATFYEVRGEYRRSEQLLAESFALPVEAQRIGILVDSHELMACTLFHQGVFARALEHADRALDFYDGLYLNALTAAYGENPGVAAHSWAALSLWFMGSPDKALRRAEDAVAMARDPRRASGLATALAQAALVRHLRREPEPTLRWAQEAVEAATARGYRYRLAMGWMLGGWARVALGAAEQGLAEIDAGLAEARATGVRMDEHYFLGLLADACLLSGRLDAGLSAVHEALETRGAERTFFYEPELHRLEGELLLRAGQRETATESLERALAAARWQGSPALELRAAVSLARALVAAGQGDEASGLVAAALAAIIDGRDTPDVRDAECVLEQLEPAPRS